MAGSNSKRTYFQSARPIWPAGRTKEMNLLVGFRAAVPATAGGPVVLTIAASSLYRLTVNGEFVGHGPARGPHGYFRVDRWDITGRLTAARNVVAMEVAGYNVTNYYLINEPAFCQAEITAGGKVLASTAGDGEQFTAAVLEYRIQKVDKYSGQRCFVEAYRLSPESDAWRKDAAAPMKGVRCEVLPGKRLLPRGVAYPEFHVVRPAEETFRGSVRINPPPAEPWKPYYLIHIGDALTGYREEELDFNASFEMQRVENTFREKVSRPVSAGAVFKLPADSYRIFRFDKDRTGFIGAKVKCGRAMRLLMVFDEILTGDDIDWKRLNCTSVVTFDIQPGSYALETIEPYVMQHLKLIAVGGECEIGDVYLREYANDETGRAAFNSPDGQLNMIFEAARETFRQNAVDLFMDCPSRERAGWLCDSFFAARAAWDLMGDTTIEHNMFENFMLPEKFPHLVEGMLPMCYPGEDITGNYIPSWAMWFVIQLEEYLGRSGDRKMIDALKPRVLALMKFFEAYRNSDGLLEKLGGWNFVEWSKANDFVQDVNYPINMFYLGALAAAGRMYGMKKLLDEAEAIRNVIRRQSFDGEFFVDNAVRTEDGSLQVTRNRTEVCQYFAFYFDVALPKTHAKLWDTLVNGFGPKRERTGAFSEIHPSEPFCGYMVRLELLSRYGATAGLADDIKMYFLKMAELTGTLWEHVKLSGSYNHGFMSHVAHVLYRDVLGVYRVDGPGRKVTLRFCDIPLESCSGCMPVGDSRVELSWRKEGGAICYRLSVPQGFNIDVQNLTKLQLRRE